MGRVPQCCKMTVSGWEAKCEPHAHHVRLQHSCPMIEFYFIHLVLTDHWYFRMKLKYQHTQVLLKNPQQEKVGVSVTAGSVCQQMTLC